MIPYGKQTISEADVQSVVDVLRSDYLTQGPVVPRFEGAIAAKTQSKYAVAANSATSALHIACMALGVGPGDLVWTTPNSFVASANCARYCGADIDFVDMDPQTYNLSTAELELKLKKALAARRLPKVVIPVHFSGQPCDMSSIGRLAKEYGFKVLEDASHAIGSKYQDYPVGACRHSDICVFSFHPVKIITTGEGGVATTNDPNLAYKMSTLRTHGITRDPIRLRSSSPPAWYYEQQDLGYNYRMIELEAALGLSQLERLEEFVSRRNQIALRYESELKSLPVQRPLLPSDACSAFHLYVVRLPNRDPVRHHAVFDMMRKSGIGVNLHYMPIHLQPYYRALGFSPGMFPEAEAYGESAITLPLFPAMSENDQDQVVAALKSALRQ
jgi:UDP-4-amino-4,6-dideoxy-N-acetyl-beta-L-altrosamine transaminase